MGDEKDTDSPVIEGKLIQFPSKNDIDMAEIGVNYASPVSAKDNEYIPTLSDLKKMEKEFKEREEFVRTQALVQSSDLKINPVDLSDLLIREIVEELSHLKWERQKLAKAGKYATNQSVSRIAALKQLSEILSKRIENARNERLDLRSPRFQQVLNLWMNFLYESMKKVNLNDQEIDLVFAQMKADMLDWEKLLVDPSDKP
jgi:hypothetical protein